MPQTQTLRKRYAASGKATEPIHYPTLYNKPGALVNLPKNELQVDKTYQRKTNERAIYRIANNWNWIACGALIISMRPDAQAYYIVDGQHRWEAAKLLDNVKELACLVFEINDIKEEAAGFLAANTERQMPAVIHRFNALMTIRDRTALVADELIRESGRLLRNQTGKQFISCIGDLMRAIRRDEKTLRRIWPVIVEITRDSSLPGTLIRGMLALERNLIGHSLTEDRIRHKLKTIGPASILASIKAVAAIEGNQNERVCAQGILRAINVGVRQPLKMR